MLSYLDAPSPVPSSKLHNCCDVCKSHCGCSDCAIKACTQTAAECSTDDDKKVPNYDKAGSVLPKTFWKILCLERRKFLPCHIL